MAELLKFPAGKQETTNAMRLAELLDDIADAIRHGAFEINGTAFGQPEMIVLGIAEGGACAITSVGRVSRRNAQAMSDRLADEIKLIQRRAPR